MTQQVAQRSVAANIATADFAKLDTAVLKAQADISAGTISDAKGTFKFRKDIQSVNKNIKAIVTNPDIKMPDTDKATLKAATGELTRITDFSPLWVIVTISLSLG
jgi:PiT family inorganic phosphate transporter